MNLRNVACIATALSFAACSGGGGSSTPPRSSPTLQSVNGTLVFALPPEKQSKARRPQFISPSTGHVALFINGAATAAGSTTTCAAATGVTPGCTLSWSAQLAVPASYTFAIEADTGANVPANTVLSEGSGLYALVAGTNTLAALSLNGVVKDASFGVTACSGAPPNSLCTGSLTLAGAAGNLIEYTGSTVVPASGNLPSSGNVFDNGVATFVSSAPATGLVTGTAAVSGGNTFSTFVTNTLTVSGVNPTGTYPYQVTCGAAANGPFGITVAGDTTPSGDVTAPELAGLATAVTYPAAAIVIIGTAPTFMCTTGAISSTTGTLPVN